MKEVSQGGSGRTVLFVSHNMAAVNTLCRSGLVLEAGRVTFAGPVAPAVRRYLESASASGRSHAEFRRPSGAPIWMHKAMLCGLQETGDALRMGDELSIRIEFRADPPTTRPRFGWVLADASGTRLLCANNRYSRFAPLPESLPLGILECRLGRVPLMPGRYSVALYLGNDALDTHSVPDALVFEVIAHDIWGEGKVPPAGVSAMWWPSEFEVLDPTPETVGHG